MTPRSRRRTLRLRSRVTVFFGTAALLASLTLAITTYAVAKSFLVDQRTSVARRQAWINAKAVKDQMLLDPATIGDFMTLDLRTEGDGFALTVLNDLRRFPTKTQFSRDAFPTELAAAVAQGFSGSQRFTVNGDHYVGVGVYIQATGTQYYEAFPLNDVDRLLRTTGTALAIGAVVTVLFASALGWSTSRRLLRPLTRVSAAAGEIASGGLDTRMAPESDPDLNRLAKSFNEMADAVQSRIEREAQFASDVSHELRSPITALSAAVEVLDARRGELPDRSQQALDVVVSQVRRFDQMVIDLLELSRIDAGSIEVHREEINLGELIGRIAHRYGFGSTPIDIASKVPAAVRIDKLRFERILANLLENANTHAGGPTRIAVEPLGRTGIVLTVDDAGPGVARGERSRIFERFARGSAARHRIGTGLGLSLVAEHAQAHGGEAWVEDRPGGGARFRVSFAEVS
jgi:two-component system, OmpR family, sensor histidine kinase MtrB